MTHDVIISAARKFSLPGNVISLIASFLDNRYQCVKWNNEYSELHQVSSGVPQGSILGPILFSMVVDSFQPLEQNTAIIKYADDINLLHFIRCPIDDKLQDEWDNCVQWSESNRLPLNFSKCHVMDIITKKGLRTNPVTTSEGEMLKNSVTMKILGVVFSSDMKWQAHVKSVLAKANKRIFIIRNLRRSNCPPHLMLNAYVAFIRSLLLYAYPVYCNFPKHLQIDLERVEKRVMRIIGSTCDVPLLTVAELQCEKLFKCITTTPGHPLRTMFVPREPNGTRNKATLMPPRSKTKRFSNSFIKFCTCHF